MGCRVLTSAVGSNKIGRGGGAELSMAGWLYKRRMLLPGTRKRWFELRGSTLFYYLEPHHDTPRAAVDVSRCEIAVRGRRDGFKFEQRLGLYLVVIYAAEWRWPVVLGLASRRACISWAAALHAAAQHTSTHISRIALSE